MKLKKLTRKQKGEQFFDVDNVYIPDDQMGLMNYDPIISKQEFKLTTYRSSAYLT